MHYFESPSAVDSFYTDRVKDFDQLSGNYWLLV